MEPKEVINILKEFGLGEYEAKSYLALLERGKVSARIVSEVTRIPYTKIYQVLQNLERYGFVVSISGKPRKHVATSPKEAIKKRMMQIDAKYQEENRRRKILGKKVTDELSPLFKSNIDEEMTRMGTRTIIGSVNVAAYIKTVILDSMKLRCTVSKMDSFIGAYEKELEETDAEIILRSPDAHPTEGMSVFLYSDYEGSDIIIKDRDVAVYTYFVASGGTYT
ncbi:MAG: helix-turn-helix domain-containing protein, partial [Euryarchaeota archaeon]|nr:helix-turn-helix domain-containing protein [Euryarchaeota archaeon]